MSLTMDPKQLVSHPPLFFLQNFLGHCGFCMPQRFYILTRVQRTPQIVYFNFQASIQFLLEHNIVYRKFIVLHIFIVKF